MRGRYNMRRRMNRMVKSMFILLIILIVSVVLVDSQLRPVVKKMAEYHAKLAATKIVNQAVSDTLAMSDLNYGDIITIEKGADNSITALYTNTAIINTIKTRATAGIEKALSDKADCTIMIPLGSLTNNNFLIGRGPQIKIKLVLSGNVITVLNNKFQEAGLNQTRHQIMLDVTADIYVVIPWYRSKTEITTNFCIAETIIVGKVPDAYTNVTEAYPETVGNINDYSATDNLKK